MKEKVKNKLEKLRNNFKTIEGRPFNKFYCPILFKDEDEDLCEAHIINKAFKNSSKKWTVQRADVDNFYGTYFESDFVKIQHRDEASLPDVLLNPKLNIS